MSRKRSAQKREVSPDPIYNSKLVTKIINTIMKSGKKGTAQSILYGALDRVKEMTQREPIDVFNEALNNIMPILEVRTRTIGSQNYQVPSEVRPERRQSLGLRWLIQYTQKRSEKTMEEKLAKEIVEAASGTGLSVKKREDTHRMAEANKAFAHYRW
ncbi:MAG: 30S ribosomal protein S7 ['Conium maculatum' witches'-broom phytoplasma]|uniref:Small ribosomal subunit protein uS7 n=2 Tax=16SrIII (X-disease group) TaxID=85623 RepID=A0A851HA02_9MOLU|nr:30S ribosomal protein S7 [Candidatus Phytoplasma pruni]MEC4558839.1 30S ribosomal protein S7 ['Conium maculatum' witches'-broom phytoplasma]NWN45772.1 30S ribosomal protein S7 [Candidatus Phytoplasma pruni]